MDSKGVAGEGGHLGVKTARVADGNVEPLSPGIANGLISEHPSPDKTNNLIGEASGPDVDSKRGSFTDNPSTSE